MFGAGAGTRWVDNEKVRFSTDYLVTYTTEDNVIDDPTYAVVVEELRTELARLQHELGDTPYEPAGADRS